MKNYYWLRVLIAFAVVVLLIAFAVVVLLIETVLLLQVANMALDICEDFHG